MRVWQGFITGVLLFGVLAPAWSQPEWTEHVSAQVLGGTPALEVRPATSVITQENVPVTFELEVINPGLSEYVFSVSPEIPNAELDQDEGVYRFHPDFLQAATYTIEFFADSTITQVSQAVTVGVENNNRLPNVLISFGNRLVVNEGESARIQMFAIDPDPDDTLIYSVTPEIDNLIMDSQTGTATFDPNFFQSAVYNVVFSVSDGHELVQVPRLIEVTNVNRAPRIVLNPRIPQTVRVGETLNLLATVFDADEEVLTVTLDGEPENSTFNASTGRFVFTPTLENFREEYILTFTARDAFTSTQIQTSISVVADIDPLFEFDANGNFEGWTFNEQVRNATVADGFLRGQSVNIDPILTRSGLAIDTVAQREIVMRLFMTPPSPVDIFFITQDGRFFGPQTITSINPNSFTTISVDFTELFDEPEVIQSIRIDPMTRVGTFIIDYVGVNKTGLPTRTPLPVPTATPRPTFTPRPSATPEASPTPTRTPTAQPDPPTPTPTQRFVVDIDFEPETSVEDTFDVIPLEGVDPPTVRRNNIEESEFLAGGVLEMLAVPGQGAMLLSRETFRIDSGTPRLSIDAWVDSLDTSIALLAFNEPFDGSFGYMIAFPGSIETMTDQPLEFSYQPPDGEYRIGLQVVHAATSTDIARIRFDNLEVERILDPFRSPLALQPDGSLDGDLSNLLFNINTDTGAVQQVRDATQSVSIQLGVNRVQNAANIALLANVVSEQLVDFLTADVQVRRHAGTGGFVDYVLTDGRSAFGQSIQGDHLPLSGSFETLQIGGRLLPSDVFIPPLLVIQHAGMFAPSAIRVDSLRLFTTVDGDE